MILRLKTSLTPRFHGRDAGRAEADGPHAPAGTRGWQVVDSPEGSATLWRRRGRLARVGSDRRRHQ